MKTTDPAPHTWTRFCRVGLLTAALGLSACRPVGPVGVPDPQGAMDATEAAFAVGALVAHASDIEPKLGPRSCQRWIARYDQNDGPRSRQARAQMPRRCWLMVECRPDTAAWFAHRTPPRAKCRAVVRRAQKERDDQREAAGRAAAERARKQRCRTPLTKLRAASNSLEQDRLEQALPAECRGRRPGQLLTECAGISKRCETGLVCQKTLCRFPSPLLIESGDDHGLTTTPSDPDEHTPTTDPSPSKTEPTPSIDRKTDDR